MKTNRKIYVYNENCTLKGRIYHGDNAEDFDDVSLYGEGTTEDLIAQALASLATRYDMPGGSRDNFRWKCDREVLYYLDGPNVEFSEEKMVYLPVD